MQLSLPPLDAFNKVIPHDHEGIENKDFIIRRIPEHWIVVDPKINGRRVSSLAYRASSGLNAGMSIDLVAQILCDGLDPRIEVTTPHWIGSLIANVGAIRELNLMVGFEPIVNINPQHGEIWGNFTS